MSGNDNTIGVNMGEKEVLGKLVSINSIFPNEGKLAIYLEKKLHSYGFSTKRDYIGKNRFNILAERGKGKDALLFYGHMDTVPIYGIWGSNPLRIKSENDKIYGLGVHDMKGGITAILENAKRQSKKKIKIAFGVDEENISEGAWHMVQNHKSWFSDVKAIVVPEAGVQDGVQGGIGVITLGRRGRCVIALEIKGKSTHGSHPLSGVSAINEAAKITLNIGKLRLRKHPRMSGESLFVRELSSSSTSLSVPETAYLEIDIHLVPPSTIDQMRKRVEAYIRLLQRRGVLNKATSVKVYVKKRKTPYLESYDTTTASHVVKKMMAIIRGINGSVKINYGLSVADENVFANLNKPIVVIGPNGGNDHSANEWVSHKSLNEVTTLFKTFIEQL
jgi:acetylornithine deacetylase/succinyl-diaminopimelate desuccinylase-like protein